MCPIASSEEEVYSPDNLIAGDSPRIATESAILVTGQNLVRGTSVGRITASGKITQCDNAAVDGSQVPVGITVHDVDATAADKNCPIYKAGNFRSSEMTWHASFDTAAEKLAAFDGTAIVIS